LAFFGESCKYFSKTGFVPPNVMPGGRRTIFSPKTGVSSMPRRTATFTREPDLTADNNFWTIFNFSPVAMAILRQSDRRYLEVNQAWQDTTGFTRDEAIGRTAEELNHIDNHLLWRQYRRTPSPKAAAEITCRDKSGQLRTGLWSIVVIDIAGEACMLIALVDTTERKKLETEMARLSRLSLVGEMAASLGHEVRNPITTVRGFLQLFRRKEQYTCDHELIDVMIAEIDRATNIINEFLSLAKEREIPLHPGNLAPVLSALVPLLQADVLRRGHQIIIEADPVADIMMCENEIQQLILNLACNAFEAMAVPGAVTIKTTMKKGKVLLLVQDTGPGIPPHILENIGTPFLTTKPGGTGLGLAICYRIAQRHGARIGVETGPTGTTFTVQFKSLPAPPPPPRPS